MQILANKTATLNLPDGNGDGTSRNLYVLAPSSEKFWRALEELEQAEIEIRHKIASRILDERGRHALKEMPRTIVEQVEFDQEASDCRATHRA